MSDAYYETREELRALRVSYGSRLPAKVSQVEALLKDVSDNKPGSRESGLKKMYLSTHTLSGTSASYGFAEFSEETHRLEDYLKNLLALPELPEDENYLETIAKYLEKIKMMAGVASTITDFKDWNY